jgi:ankyrin repeat protein
MVKVLIESGGADICLAGHSGQTALHIAFGRGMFLTATSLVDGVKTLQPSQQVQAYSAVDNEGCTAFHQLIRACLKSGADKVALDVAVRLLRLVSPAHLNTVDAQGQNLLHLVCSGEATELRLQLANSLLELQVSPLTVAHDGSTAASQASKAVGDKRRDLCKLLDHFH